MLHNDKYIYFKVQNQINTSKYENTVQKSLEKYFCLQDGFERNYKII